MLTAQRRPCPQPAAQAHVCVTLRPKHSFGPTAPSRQWWAVPKVPGFTALPAVVCWAWWFRGLGSPLSGRKGKACGMALTQGRGPCHGQAGREILLWPSGGRGPSSDIEGPGQQGVLLPKTAVGTAPRGPGKPSDLRLETLKPLQVGPCWLLRPASEHSAYQYPSLPSSLVSQRK